MWTRCALIAGLFLTLAAFACRPEESSTAASGSSARPSPLAASSAGSASPPAPEMAPGTSGGGGAVEVDGGLGLFAPALPGIGLDTHSTECDPFENDSEVCF